MAIAAAGFAAITYDARDTGSSSRSADPYTPKDLATDASRLLEALGVEACHVLGFSLGGATAMELAITIPERIRSLVLLSTWAKSDRYFHDQMRNWQAIRRATVGEERAFLQALNPWMFSSKTLEDGERLRAIGAGWMEEPLQEPEAFIRQTEADIAHDVADRLPEIHAPSLVIVGEDDICTPPRYSIELVEGLSDARLVMIPSAGHCAIYERPDEVHEAVIDFLRRRS